MLFFGWCCLEAWPPQGIQSLSGGIDLPSPEPTEVDLRNQTLNDVAKAVGWIGWQVVGWVAKGWLGLVLLKGPCLIVWCTVFSLLERHVWVFVSQNSEAVFLEHRTTVPGPPGASNEVRTAPWGLLVCICWVGQSYLGTLSAGHHSCNQGIF